MAYQGSGSLSVDKEIMETLGVNIKDLLLSLRNKAVDFEWNNDKILAWYQTEGRKLEKKAPFKKILVAIVYLLCRNDLETIAENERVIAHIKELEMQRSDELKKLRAQVEAFVYDKQTWARQGSAIESQMKKLEKKLKLDKDYTSALEDCCESAGFPVSAVVAAISSKMGNANGQNSDSDEDDVALLSSSLQGHLDLRERELSPGPAKEQKLSDERKQRSPIITRVKSGLVLRKPVKIAVLKTMTNADDEVTTISRPLTCEESTKHKEVVGMMPRKGPFQPYWDNLMLQASVYKLEIRDVWQVALLTIPDELKPKIPRELRNGEIIIKQEDEDDDDVKPTQCPKLHPTPPGGLIRGNVNKTLLHDVNLVITHVTYNISNILSAYEKHCDINDKTYTWLQSRIDDLVSDYKNRLAVQIPPVRTKRAISNNYKITGQSQFSTWLANQVATGFQHITNSNENIIKAVRSEAQALLTTSQTIFNQTRTIEHDLACRLYAQDLFTAARQEILDPRLYKTPRHVLNDLIEILDLHRWLASEKMKNIKYSELLSTLMMYTGNECTGCIGFFATFPLIHPDQVYLNSTTIRSIGVVVKDQIIKWDYLTGYMTLRGIETLFTTRSCCHETSSYVICTCNTLQPFSANDSKLVNVQSLHGHSDAVQVSHTQWCIVSEMNSFTYGGLTCPANHTFCLEVKEDFSMGQINILGRVPMDADVSPWWEDTFYEQSTQDFVNTMDLVQEMILQTEYHLNQAQVEANLAKKTAEILSSSSTRSAQYAYTWWDWMFRGCAMASVFIFLFTLCQCFYFRSLLRAMRTSTNMAIALSPLQIPALRKVQL
ncbi:uncharacterized protein [Pseudorasbora parva]|uniref:uncharacterized protein n=1 Tax=Pseudorasbora parva TaxID=51549 RepID=UPI00351EA136